MPYCDSNTHLSLGKRNPVHRRLFERPYSRQFFWLCFTASLVFPVPQWRYKASSTLQLRDSTGFAPVYLLSINTPDTFVFYCFTIRFLTAYLLDATMHPILYKKTTVDRSSQIIYCMYLLFSSFCLHFDYKTVYS